MVVRTRRLSDWLRTETGSAALLVAVAIAALVWANLPSDSYAELWHTEVGLSFGAHGVDMSLQHWINDGLMVLFFFVIGLEVRQEFSVGSLRDRRRAMVPLVAGVIPVTVSVSPSGSVSFASGVTSTGVPPMVLPKERASNTQTSARSMPDVVKRGLAGFPPPNTPAIEECVRC